MRKQGSEIYVLYDRGMSVTLHGSRLPGQFVSYCPSEYAFSTYCKLGFAFQKPV